MSFKTKKRAKANERHNSALFWFVGSMILFLAFVAFLGWNDSTSVHGQTTASRFSILGRGKPHAAAIPPNPAPATQGPWDQALTKGKQLVAIIGAAPSCFAQSQWMDYDDLNEFGWVRTKLADNGKLWDVTQLGAGIVNMYEALQVSTKLSDNPWIEWEHAHDSGLPASNGNPPRIFRATMGNYQVVYNQDLLVMYSVYGPATMGQRQVPKVEGTGLVPLRQLSDVSWLEWSHIYNRLDDLRHLKGILHADVQNEETEVIIRMSLSEANKQLKWWQSTDGPQGPSFFPADSDAAKALLGTPNGNGVAWMLAQHKEACGYYEVTGVSIFHNQANAQPNGDTPDDPVFNLLFHLEAKDAPDSWYS